MILLATGIPLVILTTIFGIGLLLEDCGACPNETIQMQRYIMIVNFGAWILAIILVIKGLKQKRKSKQQEQINQDKIRYNAKKQQDDEIQKLKDKVKELEKYKEKKD